MGSIASSILGGNQQQQLANLPALAAQLAPVQNQQPQAASISPIQVQTGSVPQAPQAVVPQEDDRRRQMIELLINQGQSEQQIQNRLPQLDKQKFFDKPSVDPQFTPGTQGPQGLLSNEEPEEEGEKPKGILGV